MFENNKNVWNSIFLTSSNERQKKSYKKQINKTGYLNTENCKIIVIPDKNNVRIGSGGATLSIIKKLYEIDKGFMHKKTLVIHSGGDSKRIPQYSAIGKLFSPVPHELENGQSSTLFNELLNAVSSIPENMEEGMLLMSGDVMLLFDQHKVSFNGKGAAAISFKEDVEIAKNHGVFLADKNNNVKSFLHKQTVDILKQVGAVDENNKTNIDTGAIFFGFDVLTSLLSLITTDNEIDEIKYEQFVNDKVRISLYGDFQYPMAKDSTLEQFYKEKPEADYSDELLECRKQIWNVLNQYQIRLISLSPARFIHFGTTRELIHLMNSCIKKYKDIGWKRTINSYVQSCAAYNSIELPLAKVSEKAYLEYSYVHGNSVIGENSIISYLEINNKNVPSDVVLHGLKLSNGKYVCRIYSVNDDPKQNVLFGKDIDKSLINSEDNSLWNTKLYKQCNSMEESVDYALKLYEWIRNDEWENVAKEQEKESLKTSFEKADIDSIQEWEDVINDMLKISGVIDKLDNNSSSFKINEIDLINTNKEKYIEDLISETDFKRALRIYLCLGKKLNNHDYIDKCYDSLSNMILKHNRNTKKKQLRINKEQHSIELPLRVNWGGGWTDTPPYCLENGGTVLNTAILLNNEYPVKVTLKRLEEKKIIIQSVDTNAYKEFYDINELQNCNDVNDPFALHKAALLISGIIPFEKK